MSVRVKFDPSPDAGVIAVMGLFPARPRQVAVIIGPQPNAPGWTVLASPAIARLLPRLDFHPPTGVRLVATEPYDLLVMSARTWRTRDQVERRVRTAFGRAAPEAVMAAAHQLERDMIRTARQKPIRSVRPLSATLRDGGKCGWPPPKTAPAD